MDQYALLTELYPLRRDIVSDGFDAALERIGARIPLTIHRFPSGTRCWTWSVPRKWTCKAAYVETMDGRRVVDQDNNPLSVASYSRRVDAVLSRSDLLAHLHTHPHLPDQAPFIFYYYQDNWAFCCGTNVKESLAEERYHVLIDSSLDDGELKVGEWLLPGECEECFVLCAHLDHPAQANDGLAGVVTGLAVMDILAQWRRTYSYRLLITAETIGGAAWLSRHENLIPSIKGGLFLEMTGLRRPPALQLSYDGDTQLDRCLRAVHLKSEDGAWVAAYRNLVGNDERQFNAPGVRIPMLSYARALPWGHPHRPYPEYHSAADNPSIASPEMLDRSRDTVLRMIEAWERNWRPRNLFKGEVFLSGYGLDVDRHRDLTLHRNMLKIMDMIDGSNSIADIALRLDLDFFDVLSLVDKLRAVGLVGE